MTGRPAVAGRERVCWLEAASWGRFAFGSEGQHPVCACCPRRGPNGPPGTGSRGERCGAAGRRIGMKLYADAPMRRGRQLLTDGAVVLWVALWVQLGRVVFYAVDRLAVPGRALPERRRRAVQLTRGRCRSGPRPADRRFFAGRVAGRGWAGGGAGCRCGWGPAVGGGPPRAGPRARRRGAANRAYAAALAAAAGQLGAHRNRRCQLPGPAG